eukprot:tig00000114_g6031.t1
MAEPPLIAIRRLSPKGQSFIPKILGRFQKLRSLSKLHENLCQYIAARRGRRGCVHVVSEHYHTTLRDRMSRWRSQRELIESSDAVLNACLQIVRALAFLSEHGVVHGTLSPDNIAFDHAGNVKLRDYGLSHITAHGHFLDSPIARPEYMAPEVVASGPASHSGPHGSKSDVWALGTILVEIYLGENPWTAGGDGTPPPSSAPSASASLYPGTIPPPRPPADSRAPGAEARRLGLRRTLPDRPRPGRRCPGGRREVWAQHSKAKVAAWIRGLLPGQSPAACEFRAFLEECLTPDPVLRPDPRDLLQQPTRSLVAGGGGGGGDGSDEEGAGADGARPTGVWVRRPRLKSASLQVKEWWTELQRSGPASAPPSAPRAGRPPRASDGDNSNSASAPARRSSASLPHLFNRSGGAVSPMTRDELLALPLADQFELWLTAGGDPTASWSPWRSPALGPGPGPTWGLLRTLGSTAASTPAIPTKRAAASRSAARRGAGPAAAAPRRPPSGGPWHRREPEAHSLAPSLLRTPAATAAAAASTAAARRLLAVSPDSPTAAGRRPASPPSPAPSSSWTRATWAQQRALSAPLEERELDAVYQAARVATFRRLLAAYPSTHSDIVREAKVDVPPLVRAEVWAVLLGAHPLSPDHALLLSGAEYDPSEGEGGMGYDDEDDDDFDTPADNQIAVDIPRCHQYHPLLASPEGHAKLRWVLKRWVALNPHLVYWQGIDSLAAPFVILNFTHPRRALACLQALVRRQLSSVFAADNVAALQAVFRKFSQLLAFHEPKLAWHLHSIGFAPELYAVPWFLTAFAHLLPLEKVLHLWDTLLVGHASLPLFVACALLRELEGQLRDLDFNACVSFFSNLPDVDVHRVSAAALAALARTPRTVLDAPVAPGPPPPPHGAPLTPATPGRLPREPAPAAGASPYGPAAPGARTELAPRIGAGELEELRAAALVVDGRHEADARAARLASFSTLRLPGAAAAAERGDYVDLSDVVAVAGEANPVVVLGGSWEATVALANALVRAEVPYVATLYGGVEAVAQVSPGLVERPFSAPAGPPHPVAAVAAVAASVPASPAQPAAPRHSDGALGHSPPGKQQQPPHRAARASLPARRHH